MSVPSGIADINADNSVKNGKYLENGKLVIVKDGKKFNVSGLRKQALGFFDKVKTLSR